jgi:hypothetical protein
MSWRRRIKLEAAEASIVVRIRSFCVLETTQYDSIADRTRKRFDGLRPSNVRGDQLMLRPNP